ncbi:MAG: 16S rRNA processing protein RimM [Bacteroidetes bacterium HGW-Bacteroidetes-15]|nr:MAG: 16S rRNA processing protein RimM [Bacteroidetes bacterium HGW-Bacteroidetes-15]
MNHPLFTEIGTIQRTHGVNGEVQVNWTNDFYPEDHNLESVFLQIEGIPIPFFIKSLRNKGQESSLIRFDEIDSIDQASELVGLKIFAEIRGKETDNELYLNDLVGFTIITNIGVKLGVIEEFQDFSGNLVFQVINSAGNEMLIPAATEFIIDIDEASKTIIMELPEGLADL